MAARIENTIPILSVSSLSASIDYYTNALGFNVDWTDGSMASVSRDGHALMLCEGAQGQPGTWVWLGVNDARTLFEELTSRKAIILQGPTSYAWALEMQVSDPDGHVLRVGSDHSENT